jgi:arginine decarboxylase
VDQSQAPILDALTTYRQRYEVAFAPPGHKQGRGVDPRVTAVLGMETFRADVLATTLDPPQERGATLKRAEELMAEAVDADQTFFSTCGSSLSVKAAMLAVAGPGDKLLIGRDAHKAVISGLVLSGIHPVWVEPSWDPERHLAHPPRADSYARAFAEHPDARGALVTSPTPYGTAVDLRALAGICHDRGLPLIVDEAWGAHLPFHDALPAWAMNAGADLCVTSIHKMGSGLEQGSVYHLKGDLVDSAVLRSRADLLDTTSPSVLLYAGMDGWRRQMVEHGHQLISDALRLAEQVRGDVDALEGLHVEGTDDFCGPDLAFALDPLQVVIDVSALGHTGYQAADWLYDRHRIEVHLADHRRISAQLTYADDHATAELLLTALGELVTQAGQLPAPRPIDVPDPGDLRLEQVLDPRRAYFSETEDVSLADAVGRVTAEVLTPYPPGIPAALPGERLNAPVLDYLGTGQAAGMVVPDAADPKLGTIRVIRE